MDNSITDTEINKSIMKTDYTEKQRNKDVNEQMVGVRRKYYREKMKEEAKKEIENVEKVKSEIDYCSTYDSELGMPDFKIPNIPTEQTELHLKYPLYKCQPITYYKQIVDTSGSLMGTTPLAGMTKVANPQDPFRRSHYFSAPLSERFDEPNLPDNWKI